jgi:RNA polymerase sigma-70 factor, ECF subfamily
VPTEVTTLLERMREGDASSREQILELLYEELRRIARHHLRGERDGHTLQPTALVNEAYVRIFASAQPRVTDRTHLLAMMSLVMRRILVDHARSRGAARRGGDQQRVTLDMNLDSGAADTLELLELDKALTALANEKPVAASYVEMHYFGGMTAEEIAENTGRSVHMVRQDLRFAQAWLRRYLAQGGG